MIADSDVAGSQVGNLSSGLSPVVSGPTDANAVPPPEQRIGGGDEVGRQAGVDQFTATQNGAAGGQSSLGGSSGSVPGFGTLVGRYRHASIRTQGSDLGQTLDEFLSSGAIGTGFAVALGDTTGATLTFPISTMPGGTGAPGSGSFLTFAGAANTTSRFGPIDTGTSFVADSQQFAYVFADETNFANHGVFGFVGVPTPTASFPASGVYAYTLQRDLFLDGDLPFIADLFGGDLGLNAVPRAFINWAPTRLFVAPNQAFSGVTTAQKSAASTIIGRVLSDDNLQPFLIGKMRGSLRETTTATTRTQFFSAAAGTSDASGLADFFGMNSPDFFVLDSFQVDNFDVGSGAGGVANFRGTLPGTTTVPNVPATRNVDPDLDDQTRTQKILLLETGGISQDWFNSGTVANFARFLTDQGSVMPSRLFLLADNTVEADLMLIGLDPDGTFGGLITGTRVRMGGLQSNSAFVSDEFFAAIESNDLSQDGGVTVLSHLLYFNSLATTISGNGLPSDFELCECAFLEAGFWGGQLRTNSTHEHDFHLVPWIAGPAVLAGDFPSTGTATYSGSVIAQVFNVNALYNVVGTVNATVDFDPGTVTVTSITISADGAVVTLTGSANAPAVVPLTGTGLLNSVTALTATGSARFAGTSLTLENMYGSYGLADGLGMYRQAGVYGADRQ